MARPSKPVIVLEKEGRSHKTKEEIRLRQEGEAQSLSGLPLSERRETKENPEAHKEFVRIKKLLRAIGKDDAVYMGIMNRYCQLYAEGLSLSERREQFESGLGELREEYKRGGMESSEYFGRVCEMQKSINAIDKISDSKRGMLLAIEKECCLTVAGALRAIPKKPAEKETEDPMTAMLGRRS